ncbi:MAG: RNA methyltransferase [Caulobacterales bacterium]|nr:RNA methyltransferase [Caulobacterales bacterium]
MATRNAARQIRSDAPGLRVVEPRQIDAALPAGASHQGLAVRCAALPATPLDALLAPCEGVLVVLDQVTDPRNVGAVLRSAAAFGARAVILQDRKAPPFFGACAKAAVGAAERLAHARVVNIARTLESLREAGWTAVGLAGGGESALASAVEKAEGGLALVLGAEDKGLRPSVAAACSGLARIPIDEAVESLNVSTAAAIALYEAGRRKRPARGP